MPDEKKVWIRNADGHKAQVLPESVDRWKPHGWVQVTGLRNGDQVWLENEVTGGKQLFAKEVVETWSALGWKPAAPPEPVDLTKDKNLTDPDQEVVEEVVVEVKPAKATSGSKKEQ